MNQHTLISPQALAFVSTPAGVTRIPVESRQQWLDMRGKDVTASVAGAVLGIHQYQTPYGLWALKSGRISDEVEETGAMLRGTLLEPAAITMLKRERPDWRVDYPLQHYWRDEAARIGATPDALAIDPERPGFGVVQIKSTEPSIFNRNWRDQDTREVEVPLWIAVQALVEAKLTGASWAAVGVMRVGHGVDFDLVDVPLHDGVWARLVGEVAAFWKRVETGEAPDVDYARDAALIAGLHPDDDGTQIDLAGDNRIIAILAERAELKAIEKAGSEAEKKRRDLDAEILAKLGAATSGRLADGRVVTAKTIRRSGYTVQPSTYRPVKIKGEIAA